ncbi:fumarylacetoacetate hydrolase family protein [Fictibacillus enclensis]|uniref:fumarylacetoacetate hydrolase family protein n=1 Tax=Fictibacillus enclensis TaxID=1017270 RepID=UPI0024BFF1BC|nr:fumarylacetoacetate hydrolase family protein [Fictibacillus enclensis]WHY71966.1 fumarylacetoacetate hydrolase family protein [Fictibacillus enclensis]
MRIVRFLDGNNVPTLGAITDNEKVYPLPFIDFLELISEAHRKAVKPVVLIQDVIETTDPYIEKPTNLKLLVPIVAPEVWASGVTYERSKQARNYEATGGREDATTYYDKVYDAERPEIFFKSTAARTVGPNQEVYLRSDSKWQIPEPELGLVLSKEGEILGYTIGNDMSCRDIEGENPLYLPQAKIWRNSCSIGPAIRLAETVEDPYSFEIKCAIYRDGTKVVEGTASTDQLKRKYDELVSYLGRDNEIFDGTILLTGTCIVPPDEFTLENGDNIEIEISDIGVLENVAKTQVRGDVLTS